jgi:predicted esterase
VALHGSSADGSSMIAVFRSLAGARRFVIVAPSSNYVPEMKTMTWRVGDHENDITDDYRHVQACLEEVAARPDVTIDRSRALIAGFSGGASSAPYIASNTGPYQAFAVLHGGVFPGGIGPRRIPGWFSTGETDPARPPDHLSGHFRTMQGLGFDVVYHLYPGAHVISPREAEDVVGWWLR